MTTTSRICPDCNEQIGDVAHWHDERPDERECNCAPGQAEMGQAGPDCPVHFEQSMPAAPDTEQVAPCPDPLAHEREADMTTAYMVGLEKGRAQAGPPPLDVERLAEALNATVGKYGWARSTPSDPVAEWLVNAQRVAAEYARLSRGEPSDE